MAAQTPSGGIQPDQRGNRLNRAIIPGEDPFEQIRMMVLGSLMTQTPYDDFEAWQSGTGTTGFSRLYTSPKNSAPGRNFGPMSSGASPGNSGAGGAKTTAASNAKTGANVASNTGKGFSWQNAAKGVLGTAYEGWQAQRDADAQIAGLQGGPSQSWTTPWAGVADQLEGLPALLQQWYAGASKAKPPGGGGGAGNQALNELLGRAMNDQSPFTSMAENFLAGRVGDGSSFNANADRIAGLAENFSNPLIGDLYGRGADFNNPFLDMFTQAVGPVGGGGFGGGRGGFSGGGRSSGGGIPAGGGPTGWSPDLVNPYLQSVLDGKFMENNPYLEQWIADQASSIRSQFTDSIIPGIGDEMERAGMLSSSIYGGALGDAQSRFIDQLGQMENQARFDAYNTGVGTYMDAVNQLTGLQNSRMNNQWAALMNSENNATSAGNAAMAAEAQRLGMMLEAAGIYNQGELGAMGIMGDMAGLYSDTGLRGLQTAGDIFLGSGQQDLGWLGLIPGLEGSRWEGFDRASGLANNMASRASDGRNQWYKEQGRQQDLLFDYINAISGLGETWGMRHGQTDNSGQIAQIKKQRPGWEDIAIGAGVSALGNWLGG